MSAFEVAAEHARSRARLAGDMRQEARRRWALVDPARISESWTRLLARLLQWITSAQRAAARSADSYLTEVLGQQGIDPAAVGSLAVDAFVGVASDGRPLESLLAQPGIVAKVALSQGQTLERAMAAGGALAELVAHTQVADAGRVADGAALATRPAVGGYVRMIVGATCSRCIILAGRVYEWNAGFLRHPKCDCIHIPAAEDTGEDLRTDPKQIFDSLSEAEQDKAFTKAGAQAIRDGADMARVVNARRGMYEAGGRLFTTEAAGRRPRLMPEGIYAEAHGNRAEALRLLKLHGFIR